MPYIKTYQGRLSVEDDAFELRANRFIVRARDADRTEIHEVAFELRGPDDGDAFSVDGAARSVSDGRYVSAPLQVRWDNHPAVDEAVVVLTRVKETRRGCKVEGEWREYSDCYPFSGRLVQFCPQG